MCIKLMIIIVIFPSFKLYPERFYEYLEMEKSDNVEELIIYTRELPERIFNFSNKKTSIKVIKNKLKFYLGIKRIIKKKIGKKKNIVILNHFINITIFSKRFRKKHFIIIITKFYSPNLMFFYKKYSDLKIDHNQFFLYLKRSLYDVYSIFFSDVIIGNSKEIESLTKKIIEFFGIKRVVLTLPTSVDTEFYYFEKRDVFSQEFKILYVGKLLERKGSFDLMKILSLLLKQKVKVEMIIVGDDGKNFENYIIKGMDKSALRDHISFLGFLDKEKLREYYHSSDILLLPSYHEGSPRVVKEAMACGLPVVCYDISGTRLIDREKNVIEFAKVGNVNILFQIVNNLICSKKLLLKMSARGRIHVEKYFSVEVVKDIQINAFSNLLNNENKKIS